jgi:hypothetical protein
MRETAGGVWRVRQTDGGERRLSPGIKNDAVIKDCEFSGLKTHWESLAWPVEGLKLRELGEASGSFAVGLNGPCKNASAHVWTLLHACTAHSKLTQVLNTIPTIFVIIGKNPYRRRPQYCTRGKRSPPESWTDAIIIVEANESIFLDANGTALLL